MFNYFVLIVSEHIDVAMSSEDFNVDEFLDGITKEWNDLPRVASCANPISQPFRNSSPPPPLPMTRVDTEILYRCPLHESGVLQKKKTVTQYGEWEYYKCPVAKCFVSCGVDRVEYYIDAVKRQLHQFYLEKMDKMQCYCERPLRMSQSQSVKNPGRLFFNCPKRNCEFFQWVDQMPSKKVRAWLLENQHPSSHAGYPRPNELFKPDGQNYVSNWIQQLPYKKQSNRFHDERIVRDHAIPEPGTPFDQELWEECQKVNIFCIEEHPDIIEFPRELKGRLFDPRKERELREDLYTLRVMAKVGEQSKNGCWSRDCFAGNRRPHTY